jgi:hypothetical protein
LTGLDCSSLRVADCGELHAVSIIAAGTGRVRTR